MTPDSPRLTDEQSAPMTVSGASVALASGAGCGKTTVLTARFLAFLDDPARLPLDQVVALTFTEKAARQLRDKVREACRKKLDQGDDPDYWRGVLRGMETARIGTFHGFCGNLIRQFPVEAGVDPGFRILEEAIAPTVRAEALDRCIRRWLAADHPDFFSLAVDRGISAVRDAIASLMTVRKGFDWESWADSTPEQVIAAWEAFRDGPGRVPIARNVQNAAAPVFQLLDQHPCSNAVMKVRIGLLRQDIPRLDAVPHLPRMLTEIRSNAMIKGGGTKKDWSSPEGYEAVGKALTEFRKVIDSALKNFEPDEGRSLRPAGDGLRFARLAIEASREYDAAKRAGGWLDFDDLLLRVRDLLRDGPETVQKEIARSIRVILVDEFQDTDATQAEILERLAGDDLISGRMFLVGDSKQSIYRFRGAQPAIFDKFRQSFPERGRLSLTENFRSVPPILHFANALFAEQFPGPEHLLRPAQSAFDVTEHSVGFLWARSSDPASDRRREEARAIATTLAHRLESGWMVRSGGKSQATRPATAGDVAILFRSLNDAPIYELALAQAGLDYHVVGGSSYFAQQEVIDLINVLSAIEDPRDALAVAGTLRGPFFGVSDDGLYWLATAAPSGLADGFERFGSISELSVDDRDVIAAAHRTLDRWRTWKDREPIAALLERILEESGFEPALLGEFLGPRKRANVRKMVEMARTFDEHGGFTLADFVAKLREDWRNPPREEQAATTDEHGPAVRLMSIHQSKGLEFPIVVVPDLDRKRPAFGSPVAIHPDLGPLAHPHEGDPDEPGDPKWSLGWKLYKGEEDRAEDEEATRLFYVAVTRAMDHLILSSGSDPIGDGASPAMKLLASRFDRQTGECIAHLPYGWPIPRAEVIPPSPPAPASRARSQAKPRLLMTVARIERTMPPGPPEVIEPVPPRPRFLDLDPARDLYPSLQRVDRLIRAAIADPGLLQRDRLDVVLSRAARSLPESSSTRTFVEARARLTPWVEGPMARQIARATEIRRNLAWTLPWPRDGSPSTVYQGRIDFAFREPSGAQVIICLGLAEASAARERTNLILSAIAAESLGIGSIDHGWWVSLGTTIGVEALHDLSPESIELPPQGHFLASSAASRIPAAEPSIDF